MLNGRYRLIEQIGVGGTAEVWRATDELLNRQVAVKLLHDAADSTQRERFVEEARTLASFNHVGLVVLLDAGILDARPFLVMTLADNSTLASRIAQGPVEPSVVTSIGSQIAVALEYVHARGFVHRDVKPSNVLLCGDGRAVLSDFGIARLVGSTMHHTRTGEAIGSPAYLAPEQVAGEALTPAVDIYSLGLVLLEALTAERAFPGAPLEAALARLTNAPPIPPTVGGEWVALLTRMTHRDPEERPTAREVAEQLGSATSAPTFASSEIGVTELDPEKTGALAIGSADAATTMRIESLVPLGTRALDEPPEPGPSAFKRRGPVLAAVAAAAFALSAFTVVHALSADSRTEARHLPLNAPVKQQPAAVRPHHAGGPAQVLPTQQPKRTTSPSATPTKAAPAGPNSPSPTPAVTPTPTPTWVPPSSPPAVPTPSPTSQTTSQTAASPSP